MEIRQYEKEVVSELTALIVKFGHDVDVKVYVDIPENIVDAYIYPTGNKDKKVNVSISLPPEFDPSMDAYELFTEYCRFKKLL